MRAPLSPEQLQHIQVQPDVQHLAVLAETYRLVEAEAQRQKHRRWSEDDDYYRTRQRLMRAHLDAADAALAAIVNTLPPATRQQPEQTYCLACLRRGVKHQVGRHVYALCPACGQAAHLVTGVLRVIGQIGGQPVLTTGSKMLYVALWQEETRQLIAAEVDELEVNGGQGISYDWALLRFLEHWQNTRPNTLLRIVFVGETLLSANTGRILGEANVHLIGPCRIS